MENDFKENYTGEEICIVGIGNVLPKSLNKEDFWANIILGDSLIKKTQKIG